jgi:hypothetical protein
VGLAIKAVLDQATQATVTWVASGKAHDCNFQLNATGKGKGFSPLELSYHKCG